MDIQHDPDKDGTIYGSTSTPCSIGANQLYVSGAVLGSTCLTQSPSQWIEQSDANTDDMLL